MTDIYLIGASDRPELRPDPLILFIPSRYQKVNKSQTIIIAMKPPIMFRIASRPIALLRPYHRPTMAPLAALSARKFSASTRRPFLDECLLGTHTLISGVHNMTGLPWAATIPLTAFLVRIFILLPLSVYTGRIRARMWRLYPRLVEARTAIEKDVRQQHGNKSQQVRQKIQDEEVKTAWNRMKYENGIQPWRTRILYIHVPISFTIMETIRRMTGTEDGILSLIGKSFAALEGKENPGLSTTDEVIPIEPSLATEGMLWFDNLMIPDSTWILPFALSGIMYTMYSYSAGCIHSCPPPWATLDHANRVESSNLQRLKYKKFGSLAIVPATLMFPSAMLLYWFSSTLATVTVGYRHEIWGMLLRAVRKSPATNEPDEDKQKSKPPTEKYYPTRNQMKKQKLNKK